MRPRRIPHARCPACHQRLRASHRLLCLGCGRCYDRCCRCAVSSPVIPLPAPAPRPGGLWAGEREAA